MSTPVKIGGYNDRDHLGRALRANADMAKIVLDVSTANVPPVLAGPLMRLAALLNQQATHLHAMQIIRADSAPDAVRDS